MKYFKANIEKPVEFISGGLFVSEVPWIHSKRTIDSFELIIGVGQCLYLSQDGVEYEVKPGDVLLLLPDRVHHGYKICGAGISFFWFHFVPETFELLGEEELAERWARLNDPAAANSQSDVCIPLFYAPAAIERVNILFQQLQHVVNSNYYTRQAANYIASSLLIELSEQMVEDYYSSSRMPQGHRSISEIIEWLRIRVQEDLSVTDIAAKFAYNKDYLSRFFKKKTGYNLQEYIHLTKISKAKDLLTRSPASIKDVAEQTGFHDEKYFMRLFRKYENMTPTEYRQAFYKIHMNNQ